MKAASCCVALLLTVAGLVGAQSVERDQFLSLSFVVDGKTASCTDLKVALHFQGRDIVPRQESHGFVVPTVFRNTEHGTDKVAVTVTCGIYSVTFPDLDPSWVSPGNWEVGIAYPPSWIDRFGPTPAIEHGAWISYLDSECNGCDPGVVTIISHPEAPITLITSLRHEQSEASGQRARDIAYGLAVLGTEYQRNRDYLVYLLSGCLARPNDSPEDEVCDSKLLSFLTNLYWRGDNELLHPLLQVADARRDVIGEIGYFYGDLLDRQTDAAVNGMNTLSIEKQLSVCAIAGADDLSLDAPKLDRVTEHLRKIATDIATRCLTNAETAVANSAIQLQH